MSKLGFVEGGPRAVIDALCEVVGPNATLLMPAYPMKSTMLAHMRDAAPFDMVADTSTMGKITELFRNRPGALRSAHPTHSVAALGPHAQLYTATHHKSGSPCGPGSPFRLLAERGGAILCIGTGVGKVTSHHNIEDLVDDFPLEVYSKGVFTKPVIFPDGHTEEVEVRVHDPVLSSRRIDSNKSVELEFLAEMKSFARVIEGKVGKATTHLFDARDLDAVNRERLQRGKTIYAELSTEPGIPRARRTLTQVRFALTGLPWPAVQWVRDRRWQGTGPNPVLVSFDVDYQRDEEALPDVLATLARHGVHASFACVGAHVEARPDPYRALVDAGHEVFNHSHTHPDNPVLSPDRTWRRINAAERHEEVARAQDALEKALGKRPAGFRLPHFGNVQDNCDDAYYAMLAHEGIRYSSSCLDFALGGLPLRKVGSVTEIGVTTCPYHPYTAMDSYHICRSKRVVYEAIHRSRHLSHSLIRALDRSSQRGLPLNVYLDPLDMAGPALNEFLTAVKERGTACMTYTQYLDEVDKGSVVARK
ncbi:MAG: AAC(3) family N-acetyltransferase [Planctomycetes bacterium]|nr:AAC(3) family N-acetyltransferase [Planctomycetota bacterium]